MSQATILYAGAGALARQVAGLLPDWPGWALNRSGTRVAHLQALVADYTRAECLPDWPAVCPDYVLVTPVPAARTEAAYRLAYVEGVRNLLCWLQRHGQSPQRILFVSSIGVYGQTDGEWVSEQSPANPERWSGQVMLEAEQLLQVSGLPVTCVRLAGLYWCG